MTTEPGSAPASAQPYPPGDALDNPEAGGRAIRGGVIRAVAYGAGTLLSAATIPLMIRHLGVGDFGRFVTASSVVMIVAGVTEAGLSSVGLREYAVTPADQRRRLIANLAGLRLVLTVLGVLAGLVFMGTAGYDSVVVLGMALAGTGLVLNVLQGTYAIPLAGDLRWALHSGLDLLRQVATGVLVLALVIVGAQLLPFFLVSIGAAVPALLATVVLLRGRIFWRPSFERSEWWRLVRDALPYAAAATVGVIYFRVAILLLGLISTEEETGYYSAALKITETIGGFAWLLVTSAFPIVARAATTDPVRLRYSLQRVFEAGAILGVWMSLSMVVGAEVAIDVIAGSEFEPAVPVLQLQGLTLAAGFLVATWSYGLLALREHRRVLVANGWALLTAVAASALLVPSGGAVGAAIATVAAEAVLATACGVLLVRTRRELRPAPRVLPSLAVATAGGAAAGLLLPVPPAVGLVLATLVYGAVLLASGAVPPELKAAIPLPGRRANRA